MELRRRDLIRATAAGAVAAGVTGCLHSGGYDPEAVRSEAEVVPYEEMSQGDRIHVKRGRVRQAQVGSDRYFISTERQDGEWTNDVFAAWDGETKFEEGDIVEFWGVVEGQRETEGGDTLPDVTVVEIRSVE